MSRPFQRFDAEAYREKKQRDKVVIRRSVDIVSPIIQSQSFRQFAPSPSLAAVGAGPPTSLQPHNTYVRYQLPPASTRANVATAVCSSLLHRPELFNFERMMARPARPVNCSTWSPNGRRLICGGNMSTQAGGTFTMWDGATFRFENMVSAHNNHIKAICWSHGENFFISADDGGVIKYFLDSCSQLHEMPGQAKGAVLDLSFSPTNAKFASCGDDTTVKIWDYITHVEERTLMGHGGVVHCCDWHPDKTLVASGEQNNVVKLWDPRDRIPALCTLHGHTNRVNRLSWNKNGRWLATSSQDNTVMLWDLRTLKAFSELRGHSNSVTALAWHPVHEHVFCSGDYSGTLVFWSTHSSVPQSVLPRVHTASLNTASWHPAGHVLATGGHDHNVKIWARPRPGQPCELEDNRLLFSARLQDLGTTAFLRTQDAEKAAEEDARREERAADAAAVKGELLDDDAAAEGPGEQEDPGRSAKEEPAEEDAESPKGRKRKRGAAEPPRKEASQAKASLPRADLGEAVPLEDAFHEVAGDAVANIWSQPAPIGGDAGLVVTAAPSGVGAGGAVPGVMVSKVPRRGYICKKCNKPGHFVQDCPLNSQPPEGYVCHVCKRPGHWKKDCPRLKERQGGSHYGGGGMGGSRGGGRGTYGGGGGGGGGGYMRDRRGPSRW